MGMFDSLYDEHSNEWQTKAYYRVLAVYGIGDSVVTDWPESYPSTYQVEIVGGGVGGVPFTDSFATVRNDVLASVNDPRDPSLPLIAYGGYLAAEGV
jgi:hypothetical protein